MLSEHIIDLSKLDAGEGDILIALPDDRIGKISMTTDGTIYIDQYHGIAALACGDSVGASVSDRVCKKVDKKLETGLTP